MGRLLRGEGGAMKRKYTARSTHKNPCDLCESPIIPGDDVRAWPWWNYEGEEGVPFGGICRVHASCYVIGEREGLMEDSLRTFVYADEERWNETGAEESIPDSAYHLTEEADAALAAARKARGER